MLTDVDLQNEGDSYTVSIVNQPSSGSAVASGDEAIYTPNADFSGSDSFTYTITDSGGLSVSGTASVTVNPVNDAPTFTESFITTNEDTTSSGFSGGGVVDVDDNSHTLTLLTLPANGTVDSTHIYIYTPNANFNGSDSFTYTATDSGGLSVTGTCEVTVNPVNDPPTATSATIITNEDTASGWTTVSLTDVDLQNEGDNYTISIVTQPSSGSAVASGDEAIYTPNADFSGSDSFTIYHHR